MIIFLGCMSIPFLYIVGMAARLALGSGAGTIGVWRWYLQYAMASRRRIRMRGKCVCLRDNSITFSP